MSNPRIAAASVPPRRQADSVLSRTLGGILHGIGRRLMRAIELHHTRQMLRELDDATLRDIGLTRGAIEFIQIDHCDKTVRRR